MIPTLAALILAAAEPTCGAYIAIEAELAGRWQEAVVGRALTTGGQMLVIFADPEGDTWTAVLVNPDATACVAAAGTAWQAMPPPPAGVEG